MIGGSRSAREQKVAHGVASSKMDVEIWYAGLLSRVVKKEMAPVVGLEPIPTSRDG